MSEPIPEEKLAEWEVLERAASRGPWRAKGVCVNHGGHSVAFASGRTDDSTPEEDAQGDRDAAFLAASREAVPALIAEVRQHRADWQKLKDPSLTEIKFTDGTVFRRVR